MTVTSQLYAGALTHMLSKRIDWVNDPISGLLVTSAYVPDTDTHLWRSQLTNEVAGTGYVAGGQALAGRTLTYVPATNTLVLAATNPVWPGLTASDIRRMIVYGNTGDPATSPLIGLVDLESPISPVNQRFEIGLAKQLFTLAAP